MINTHSTEKFNQNVFVFVNKSFKIISMDSCKNYSLSRTSLLRSCTNLRTNLPKRCKWEFNQPISLHFTLIYAG